jgi:outer membrane protein OmpA-like peptidoglycan-associated protein
MPRFLSTSAPVGAPVGALVGALFLAACATQAPQAKFDIYQITFDKGSYAIDPVGQQTIRDVASAMEANKTSSLTIVGQTDATGSPDDNSKLSQKRAIAVHDALVATGKISPARIETAWTTEQPRNAATASSTVGSRIVDILVH